MVAPMQTIRRAVRRPAVQLTEDQLAEAFANAPDNGGYKTVTTHLRLGDTLRANGLLYVGVGFYDMILLPNGEIVVESRPQ